MKKRLLKKLRNSWNAFHSGELIYRLQIDRFGGFEVAYRSGTADEKVIGHSFDNDIFFTGVPECELKTDDVVLDIGAHIGTFSLLAGSKVPDGHVYAIEASGETFNYLRVNASLNRLDNVTPCLLALTDKKGTVRLHHDRGNWGHSIMKEMSSKFEEVPADTLENFLNQHSIQECAFAKFNCEGAEFPILVNSSEATLRRIRMMLVLYHEDLATGYTLPGLQQKLSDCGFAVELRNTRPSGVRGWLVATRQ